MRTLLPVLLAPLLAAQDPFPPAGGWPVLRYDYGPTSPAGPLTWVDNVVTALDIYYPDPAAVATPPQNGWPIVLLIHGGVANRRIDPITTRAPHLAAVGYVCLAYDVRGNGVTVGANPSGYDASEEARLRDMAELITRANSLMPPGVMADNTRVAVTGESMGGRHSYRAAAYSGLARTTSNGSPASRAASTR